MKTIFLFLGQLSLSGLVWAQSEENLCPSGEELQKGHVLVGYSKPNANFYYSDSSSSNVIWEYKRKNMTFYPLMVVDDVNIKDKICRFGKIEAGLLIYR